jgi:hypothetical protein
MRPVGLQLGDACHLGRRGLGEETPLAVHRACVGRREGVNGRQPDTCDQLEQGLGLRMQHAALREVGERFFVPMVPAIDAHKARRLPVLVRHSQRNPMDARKQPMQGQTEPQLDAAMKALGLAVHDAEESLLDLEDAIAALRVARDPALALDIELATVICLNEAMRR